MTQSMTFLPPTTSFARLQPARRRLALVSLARAVTALMLSLGATAASAQSKPSEYDVKAAYLFNFGKFMRHSSAYARRATFDICILGRDPIGRTIDDIAANESINNLPVRVIRIPDVTNAKSCGIVYVTASEDVHLREDMAILAGSEVLTVSDSPTFLQVGGMVQFVLVSNHVRFAVNLNALNRSHLVLSSELLKVAASVTGKPGSEGAP
jgi:YfiR/HmsC-like